MLAWGLALLGVAVRLPRLNWGLPDIEEEALPMKKALEMWGWDTLGQAYEAHDDLSLAQQTFEACRRSATKLGDVERAGWATQQLERLGQPK